MGRVKSLVLPFIETTRFPVAPAPAEFPSVFPAGTLPNVPEERVGERRARRRENPIGGRGVPTFPNVPEERVGEACVRAAEIAWDFLPVDMGFGFWKNSRCRTLMMEPSAWGGLGAAAATDEAPSPCPSVERAPPMIAPTPS